MGQTSGLGNKHRPPYREGWRSVLSMDLPAGAFTGVKNTLFFQKMRFCLSCESPMTTRGTEISQPFTSTGKERDAETGFSYFGARYYDSDLSGLFLSVDPMSDKYPSISPYAYCIWNPVKLVDPDGGDLYIPKITEGNQYTAKNDILSLVKEKNRSLITIDENGKIGFSEDISLGKQKNDKGLSLLYDLVKSDKKFFYETSDDVLSTITTEGIKNMSENEHGVINASNYGLDSEGKHIYRPKEGFDGQVILSKSGIWKNGEGKNLRKSVLFHELAENYYRTHDNNDYYTAHEKAVLREGLYFGNKHPGCFYPSIGMSYTFKGQKAMW